MPGNLKKMTESQKEMCGCDICIDGRAMHSALCGWRSERVLFYDRFADELRAQKYEDHAVQIESFRDEMIQEVFVPLGIDDMNAKPHELKLPRMRKQRYSADDL